MGLTVTSRAVFKVTTLQFEKKMEKKNYPVLYSKLFTVKS